MANSEASDAVLVETDQKAQNVDQGELDKLSDNEASQNSREGSSGQQALHMTQGVEPYYISRKKDDLIIAVWQDKRQKILSSDEKLVEPTIGVSNDVDKDYMASHRLDPRTITLSHQNGDEFLIPWALCSKWRWMKEVIKLTYGGNDAAKESITNGTFKIYQNGAIILIEKWHMLAKPWMHLGIKLDEEDTVGRPRSARSPFSYQPSLHPPNLYSPSFHLPPMFPPSPPSPPSEEESDLPEVLEGSIRYRIDFWLEDKRTPPYFSRTEVYDKPLVIEKAGETEGVVIEEINKIVQFQSPRNHPGGVPGAMPPSKTDGRKLDKSKNSFTLEISDSVELKKLHVKSSLLLNALRFVVKYNSVFSLGDTFEYGMAMPHPGPGFQSGEETEALVSGIFLFPFKELYHHIQELQAYKTQTTAPRCNHSVEENAACDRHIDILLDYLYAEPTVQLSSVLEKWKQKIPTTTFTAFWLLIKPGTDVYVKENGQLNAYVVDQVSGGHKHDFWNFKATSYSIRVWNLISNGKVITRWSKTIHVPVFDGEREIVSLPVFPTYFQDELDNGTLRKRLIERGSKFVQFARSPAYLEYTGVGLKPGMKQYNRARVVVEHESQPWSFEEWVWPQLKFSLDRAALPQQGRARVARCECSKCTLINRREGSNISPAFSDYDDIDVKNETDLSDHQLLLCMSHMFGFILKDRTYDILDINGLSQPTLNETALDDLVLRPEKNKETIKSIVRTYTDSDSQADLFSVDFIRGKGEGQVFLLHGPPGTGKTLTAESVAEYTKRPLLSITAADLGHSPTELEKNLLRFFDNATAWGAVVLLDEADVYLERRSANDLQRNSIVSIFLRALDYFEGILFFTTNRVGQFDEAFMSRIHVAIGYDALDKDARDQIWDAFFRKLKETARRGGPRIESEYEAKEYVRKSEEVKSLDWNGRQIRNAFQTAVALAIADSKAAKAKGRPEEECIPLLTEAHLRQVVHMSGAFKSYIKATHEGMSESERAFLFGNRHDQPVPRN